MDNVSFAYRDNQRVLDHISVQVPARGFVALVGHTGSGKSTLASLLMGYYQPDEGEIRLDDRPLTSLSHQALRQNVAIVQQNPMVLADSLYANVTLGRDIPEDEVWRVLEIVYNSLRWQGHCPKAYIAPLASKAIRFLWDRSSFFLWPVCW